MEFEFKMYHMFMQLYKRERLGRIQFSKEYFEKGRNHVSAYAQLDTLTCNDEPVYAWNFMTDQMEFHAAYTGKVGFRVVGRTKERLSYHDSFTGENKWIHTDREGIDWYYTKRPWSDS